MNSFKTLEGPYIKKNTSVSFMMKHLLIALTPIVLFSVYKNGYIPYKEGYISAIAIFYPLLFILIGMLTSALTELAFFKITKKNLKEEMKNSYALIPGLFVALVLPLNTPILILIFGCIIASFVGKIIFGGFGNNIFNPALIGVLFVATMFSLNIAENGGYLNEYEADTISSATPLSVQTEDIGSYEEYVKPYGTLKDFVIGTTPGSVGETSGLLILLAFAYMTYKKILKWPITTSYIFTVFVMTYLIGSFNDLGIWFSIFHVFSGGLLFGAVFMATDPVTSPVTPVGQMLYGLFLGILTVMFRFLTSYPEGVMTAILTMNMFVFILDKIGSKARLNFSKATISFVLAWSLIIIMSLVIAGSFSETEADPNFNLISVDESGSELTYIVEQRGHNGFIKAEVIVDNGEITNFEIISSLETSSYFQKLYDADYFNELINSDDFDDVDTISSATVSSTAVKKMFINVMEDYNERKN